MQTYADSIPAGTDCINTAYIYKSVLVFLSVPQGKNYIFCTNLLTIVPPSAIIQGKMVTPLILIAGPLLR
jgi:hypothetical protein